MLLSTSIELPSSILLDALIDYVNPNEREKLKYALEGKDFLEIKSEVIAVLSRFGCRQVPTIATLPNILLDVARYEFCVKPAAAISIVYNGIPEEHKQFWKDLGTEGICKLYHSLTTTPEKVLSILDCCATNL